MIEEEVIQNNDGTETFILHNVPQQQQSKQIIINNPNEIVNYTTSGAQQAQPGMSHSFEIDYRYSEIASNLWVAAETMSLVTPDLKP